MLHPCWPTAGPHQQHNTNTNDTHQLSDAAATISSIGITNGDSLTVRELMPAAAAAPPPAAPAAAPPAPAAAAVPRPAAAAAQPAAAPALSGVGVGGFVDSYAAFNGSHHMDEDAALAAALAASMNDSQPTAAAAAAAAPKAPAAAAAGGSKGAAGPAPTAVALPDGCAVTRRIMASDNSCLFNAVGYVMEGTRTKAQELRGVISRVVSSDPGECSRFVLLWVA
jgi:hypothetical protein